MDGIVLIVFIVFLFLFTKRWVVVWDNWETNILFFYGLATCNAGLGGYLLFGGCCLGNIEYLCSAKNDRYYSIYSGYRLLFVEDYWRWRLRRYATY